MKNNFSEKTFSVVEYLNPNTLTPSPFNSQIYSDLHQIEDLVYSLTATGTMLTPIIINNNNMVLSGHRRLSAAKKLGWETVPVRRLILNLNEAEILVHSNFSRPKPYLLIMREVDVLREKITEWRKSKSFEILAQLLPMGVDTKRGWDSNKVLASIYQIGLTNFKYIVAIYKYDPMLLFEVDAQKTTINKAYKIVKAKGKTEKEELFTYQHRFCHECLHSHKVKVPMPIDYETIVFDLKVIKQRFGKMDFLKSYRQILDKNKISGEDLGEVEEIFEGILCGEKFTNQPLFEEDGGLVEVETKSVAKVQLLLPVGTEVQYPSSTWPPLSETDAIGSPETTEIKASIPFQIPSTSANEENKINNEANPETL